MLAAIADWEAVLPGAEFSLTCTQQNVLRVQRTSISGVPTVCSILSVACAFSQLYSDPQRGGKYSGAESFIWFNDHPTEGYTFTPDGERVVMSHELGHIFGLHEGYDHDPEYSPSSVACHQIPPRNEPTIMDAFTGTEPAGGQQGQVTGGCDNVLSPTSRDIDLVRSLYDLSRPSSLTPIWPPGFPGFSGGPDLSVRFFDPNVAESGYGVIIQQYVDIGWVQVNSRYFMNGIAPYNHTLTFSWHRPTDLPDGYYRFCIYEDSLEYLGRSPPAPHTSA